MSFSLAWGRKAAFVSSLAVLIVGASYFKFRDDGLGEVRRLARSENLHFDPNSGMVWRAYQFAEPCSVVSTKLANWKQEWEQSGRKFAMTDMADAEFGPSIWARDKEFALMPPQRLMPEMKCGFQFGQQRKASMTTKAITWMKRLWSRCLSAEVPYRSASS